MAKVEDDENNKKPQARKHHGHKHLPLWYNQPLKEPHTQIKQWRDVGVAFCLRQACLGIVHLLVPAVAEDPGSRPSAAAVPVSCTRVVCQADETCVLAVH